MIRKTAYIAIETKARELDAKTLLSAVLAERGFEVFLGHKSAVRRAAGEMLPGIYMEKSAARTKVDLFRTLKSEGHDIVVHDEEGLVVLSDKAYLKKRISRDALTMVARFFTWGRAQADRITAAHPEYADRLVPTGHPKFDLLSEGLSGVYRDQCEAIHERFNRYVLVNTKFGTCNNAQGKENYFQYNVKAGLFGDAEEIARWRGYFEFSERLLHEFQRMLSAMSERFPDLSFVIRPHPSERMETWEKFAAPFANMHVVREGNVHPWIKGALLVLHNGCTTAIEACFLHVPAIAYRPITSAEYDVQLPNSVSLEATSLDELTALVRGVTSGFPPGLSERSRAELSSHISTIPGRLAADVIAEEFDVLQGQRRPDPVSVSRRLRLALARYYRRKDRLRARKRHGKFDSLQASEVRSFLGSLTAETGRFRGVCVEGFGENCVRLFPASRGKIKVMRRWGHE